MPIRRIAAAVSLAGVFWGVQSLAAAGAAQAAESYVLVIKDHRFEPAELHVPANKKVKLVVRNEDPTAEEFESYELNREKIIPGGSEGAVYVGPLDPGRYPFFGEFHQDTAQGILVAE